MLTNILKIKCTPTGSRDVERVFSKIYTKNRADNSSIFLFQDLMNHTVRLDSSMGLATTYGLDGPGIETRYGRDFSHLSVPALWHNEPPIQWIPDHFLEVKRPGRGANYQSPT